MERALLYIRPVFSNGDGHDMKRTADRGRKDMTKRTSRGSSSSGKAQKSTATVTSKIKMKSPPIALLASSPGLALLASGQHAVTPFQKKVLEALCEVPEGKVTTYKYLAQHVNCGSQQAVGQALRRNPYAPVVACHRVVAHSRQLGGFGGARDGVKLEKKRKLLEEEGVCFDQDGTVASSSIFDFNKTTKKAEQDPK